MKKEFTKRIPDITDALKNVLVIVLCTVIVIGCAVINGVDLCAVYAGKTNRKLPIYRVKRQDKKIAISFDCAWGTDYTDELLRVMKNYDVKCTFFAVEFWTTKHPDYVRKIVADGHEIGTHGATHSHMKKLSATAIDEELKSSSSAISDITGVPVTLFRAPYGEYNDTVISVAEKNGLVTVQWDVDSLDWKNLSAKEIASRVLKQIKPGSVILCHNNGLHTAEALPMILSAAKNIGYEFVPISKLIYTEKYIIKADGEQTLADQATND